MRQFFSELRNFTRKGDLVLLSVCLTLTAFGCVVIASATNVYNNPRYVIIQAGAAVLGMITYAIVSSIDVAFFSEHRTALSVLSVGFLLLLVPFGVEHGGNKSWLDFPFLPVEIQPAEIIKLAFILILASVMASHQNRPSAFRSVMHMVYYLGLIVGLNLVLSGDYGVSLIFVFVFIGMAFAGGISMGWFILAISAIVAVAPFFWNYIMPEYQKDRILALIDPNIDPLGLDELYQFTLSKRSLTGGGFFGQGLFEGTRTQTEGALFAQHTDFIFSAIGEELGFFGCMLVLVLEFAIIARCIYVGMRCQDYIRRLVCYGAASALIFQVTINVGMCIGVMPVIGLTLPLISYGGSSVVTIFAMLGLVSGAYARPQSQSHERYIQPYR